MRTIFVGSSEFGIPALKRLKEYAPPILVIAQPDRAAGRHLKNQACPLAKCASELGLEVFKPQDINSEESLARMEVLRPDLFITASYGGMLKRKLRKIATHEAINLHPSLLPLYRGPTPIQSALLNGDSITGLTIFRLTGRMDAGPVLFQRELPINDEDNFT
ncbi:MAG: methionyl-tRNA formyltransferase, partial [Candidatus Syntrophosphaera sp.]